MVGSIYKVISKLLATRLRRVSPSLVGESQTAFVAGRQILDGALISNEIINLVENSKLEVALMKLDSQKQIGSSTYEAYDTVNWDFIDHVLDLMGFGNSWRNWIRCCLSTASISILVNGSPTAPFRMERGLRQGDPLSHFLFVLAAEIFNILMKRAVGIGLFEGLQIGSQDVRVSHLQFADDTLIFCPAKTKWWIKLRRIMECFQLLSGLKINRAKSGLIVIGRQEIWAANVANRLGCQPVKLPSRYLGIPLGTNPNKLSIWEPVLSKIHQSLAVLKAKLLSRAGRLMLIKAVLNSLLLYYMSIFKIPKCVVKKIIQMQRKFFWRGNGSGKGLPLIKWSEIQKPKSHGGLGIDDLIIKNAGLLFKWWWQFSEDGNPLWKRAICSIHKLDPALPIINQQEKGLKSNLWRNISKVAVSGMRESKK